MHQALYTVIQLHKNSKASNTADDTLKSITYKLLHILYLLQIGSIPFSINGNSLPLRSMVCSFCQLFNNLLPLLLGNRSCGKGFPQQTVHHQIRITADWRSKMGIILGRQAKMPQIFCCIASLLHRTQGHGAYNLLCRASCDFLQYCLQILWLNTAVMGSANMQTKGAQQSIQCCNLGFIWIFVDTVDKRLLAAAHMLSHSFIGSQHTLLYNGFT